MTAHACCPPTARARPAAAGVGAVLSLPWTRLGEWYDALPDLSRRGFTTVALLTGMKVGGGGIDLVGLYALALLVNTGATFRSSTGTTTCPGSTGSA